jgi:hypothetical protein
VKGLKPTLISAIAIGLLAGSAVGVAAQDEATDTMAPAYVTGTVTPGSVGSEGTTTYVDDFIGLDGYESTDRLAASDPRLTGTVSYTGNSKIYEAARFDVQAGTVVLVSDDGRWVGTTTGLSSYGLNSDTVVLHGEDAYEGLTAYVLLDWTSSPASFKAAIFPGEMPAFPEMPTE